MLQIPYWYRILTGLIIATGMLFALPNVLPGWVLARMPGWLPSNTISLGLDLQGGSYVLLEVEVDQIYKDKIQSLTADIRVGLRKAGIGYRNLLPGPDSFSLTILDPARYDDPKTILNNLDPVVRGSLITAGS